MNLRRYKWLRNRSLVGKLLRLPFRLIPQNAVVRIIGGPLKGCRWIKGSHNISILLGTYEKRQSHEFAARSLHSNVFWDLGAHVGYYSLLFKKLNFKGKVFAFEPMKFNADLFRRHMSLNHVEHITLFENAVSLQKGILRFNTGATSVAGRLDDAGLLEIVTIKLSEWVKESRIEMPDLIKMDIEGAEFDVLTDLKSILCARKPAIFLSTHGEAIHRECVKLLKSIGYQLTPLDVKDLNDSRELLAV